MKYNVHGAPADKSDLGRAPFRDFQDLVDLALGIAAYDRRFDEVLPAAVTAVEYAAELDALDWCEKCALARRLFAGNRFHYLRFSAKQVYCAFEALGHPHFIEQGVPVDVQVYRDAILHLANPVLRDHLARELFLCLPEYVAAEYRIEAAMILLCALLTAQEHDEVNLFLNVMFEFGLVDWITGGHRRAVYMNKREA